MSKYSYHLAKWILDGKGNEYEDSCLVLANNKINSIISKQEYEREKENNKQNLKLQIYDYGNSVITPGLINLHTHLDYSALKHFDNYSSFFGWIKGLVSNSWQWSKEEWLASALMGINELLESGTSTVVDSSYSGNAAVAAAKAGLRAIVGLELFGIDESNSESTWQAWLAKYNSFISSADTELKEAINNKRIIITVAPHTPYTACPSLIKQALEWTQKNNLPLLIHIAESMAESEWISKDCLALDQFLQEIFKNEYSDISWRGKGLSPVEHMQSYSLLAKNILAAHLVQINENDIDTLIKQEVSMAHCPRSNSRLRNGIAPLTKLIKKGAKLGFGTDSSASTDDLNIIQEARFACNLHRAIDPTFNFTAKECLHYLTYKAAESIGMEKIIGSLEPGKEGDFTVFSLEKLPKVAQQRPYESIINGGALPISLNVAGKEIWKLQTKA